jgi:hypothetical protein
VAQVAGAHPHQRVRVPGDGEQGLGLRQPGHDLPDVLDVRGAEEPELGEGLDPPAKLGVVDLHGEAGDDAVALQPVDPPLDRGDRQRHPLGDVGQGAPRVFL